MIKVAKEPRARTSKLHGCLHALAQNGDFSQYFPGTRDVITETTRWHVRRSGMLFILAIFTASDDCKVSTVSNQLLLPLSNACLWHESSESRRSI
jgi:hypothetical protein